jgi:hypothetical protein
MFYIVSIILLMFRNNFNDTLPEINSSTPIGILNYIKRILTNHRENYINLLNENRRMIEIIDNYIDFLRSTNKNIESLQFTIKHIIELFNYLGR